MERPKGVVQPIEREITGEVAYLDDMRRLGEPVKAYPGDLSDMAIQLYEEEAAIMRERGVAPAIFAQYEQYDREVSPLGASCAALAEELLKLKEPGSRWTFENYILEESPEDILAKLGALKAGKLLVADDEQLAIPSNSEYYPVLDIKKKDMQLHSVDLKVFGWSEDRKYVFTNAPGESYHYPEDFLQYPSDEQSKWYEFELSFGYSHPEAGSVVESVALSVGQRGDVRLSRKLWASAYAETGYEGHNNTGLDSASDEDVAEFADFIAEIVGDEPEAIWQRQQKVLREFIASIHDDVSSEYLEEWLDNTTASSIIGTLNTVYIDKLTLGQLLRVGSKQDVARQALIDAVNEDRKRRNDLAADEEKSRMWFGESTAPWRDRVAREA